MKEISKTLKVNESYITSYGLIGKCDHCGNARGSTETLWGHRYCNICAAKYYPNISAARFEETDAKFKCRAGIDKGCGADQLSYTEFHIGSCCQNAATVIEKHKYEVLAIVNEIYEKTRKQEGIAEMKAEDAKKKVDESKKLMEEAKKKVEEGKKLVEEAKKMMKKAKKADEDAKTEAAKSNKELEKIITFRKKVQKRSLFLTKDAMKEDNNDDELPEPKRPRTDREEENKPNCKVCFEIFDENHPEAVLTTCGHKACYNCLFSLPRNSCPTCRKAFRKRNILKVFD